MSFTSCVDKVKRDLTMPEYRSNKTTHHPKSPSWLPPVGYPSRRPKGCGLQLPLGPKSTHPKSTHTHVARREEEGWRRRRRRSLLRIVPARGAIPNEMGPTRCRATPALTNQPTSRWGWRGQTGLQATTTFRALRVGGSSIPL
jgi:hypothetical protein